MDGRDLGGQYANKCELQLKGVDMKYGMNMNGIHALGASVSMATGGAKSIGGGNWKIFKAMVENSKARLRLNTEACPCSMT